MSRIEWTNETWNPLRGCSRVSAGCGGSDGGGCYAERMAHRFSGTGQPYEGLTRMTKHGPRWTGEVRFVSEQLDAPLRWRKPRMVFVASMSDLFHEKVSDEQIASVFGVMAACPQHTFQCLTKRPKRMLEWFSSRFGLENAEQTVARDAEHRGGVIWDSRGSERFRYPSNAGDVSNRRPWPGWPLPNLWLGVSVENQAAANERIPLLLQTPAAIRWGSAEPLLGPLDLDQYVRQFCGCGMQTDACDDWKGASKAGCKNAPPRLNWVVVGGESGPGARPCDVQWIRDVVAQCSEASIPCFVKQLGANAITRNDDDFTGWGDGDPDWLSWPDHLVAEDRIEDASPSCVYQGAPVRLHFRKKKGSDPSEWPEQLRVREFPTVTP